MRPKAKLSLGISLAVIAVMGGALYYFQQRELSRRMQLSLAADGRFIASTWLQYALEHPEVESMEFEEFLKVADAEYGGRLQWVSWKDDATYDGELNINGGVIIMTHPKVHEPVYFTY